ncbi:MAG: biopolymer transporter ExbD [Pyrinomonadaceae bacterium]|nr:biopolymer transporter ExbD [Pyrinomonadaceae bacterium]
MGMAAGGSGDINSEINVTPMVDIMLVLLIIFMVITPLLQHGVSVTLPKELRNPEEDPRIVKDGSVVIAVTKDNEYYIGKKAYKTEELETTLTEIMKDKTKEEERVVYIKGDSNARYESIVSVINAVRKSGIERIGLVADKKKGSAAGPTATPAPAT